MQATATPFVSYSGNHGDVLLHRLFGARDSGFFVDVGAGHPMLGNATKALSDRGWTGIDIEPQPDLHRELVGQRPRDRVLAELSGLRAILEEAAPPRIDLLRIDLLRIGLAGAEAEVLASNDWHRFRPVLVMVAASGPDAIGPHGTSPGTAFLEGRGYRHVHFDGLNDYHVETGFDLPAGVFDRPLNGLDNFVPYGVVLLTAERDAAQRRAEAHASLMAERIRALEIDLDRANQEIVALRRQISEKVAAGYVIPASRPADQLAREIAALYASTSWRITSPLRALARLGQTLKIFLGRVAR
jgi:hypothetical protein